jgi:tRNA U34 5-carboxymethylaminomethyl modifying GTPase MnmE/TrmE
VKDCPQSGLPEYAFIGRSNVGKSSLINMLCHNPKLAKTSQKPGKTLLINHFLVESQESRGKSQELRISAKNGDIEPLKRELVRIAKGTMQTSAVMLSNARHYEAVTRAHAAIERVQEGLKEGLSGELLSMDLNDCLNALGEVTGQITNSEVLANIFSKFCIGK